MSIPRPLIRYCRLLTASAALYLLAAAPSGAVTILSVGDGDNDTGSILVAPGTSTQALAAGFQLTSGFSDVSISAALTCLQCQAQFYLMADSIGPGSNFVANVRAVTTIDTLGGGGFIDQSTSLFSSLSLSAGNYFLVMALTPDTVSGAIWSATQAPSLTAITGANNLPDLMAFSGEFNSTTPPLSVFQSYEVGGVPTWLQFSLDVPEAAPPVPVPGPATGILLLGGILGLLAVRRRET